MLESVTNGLEVSIMRVTNKMIMNNSASNINSAKEVVNTRNKQMTSQKRIDKPSDDPVIAVRSLRLATTLSQVSQYYSKNIPDANQWLDITETALINIKDVATDCKTICVGGSTDSYNSQSDRKTMLTQLESLQKALFAEGNADYANRTVFTGYRTNSNLTFTEDETKTKYRIDQTLSIEDLMEEHRYYSGNVVVPTTEAEVIAPKDNATLISDITETDYYRLRLNYKDIDSVNSINIKYEGNTSDTPDISFAFTETNGVYNDDTSGGALTSNGFSLRVYENETDWANADTTDKVKKVENNEIVFIRQTGDIIFGDTVASTLKTNKAELAVQYDKTGFKEGQLRPEYYYNCTKMIDSTGATLTSNNEYTKFDANGNVIHFDIEYTIAANQTIAINTEASDVFDSSLQRDLDEMMNAVQRVIAAYDKLDTIQGMKSETQYASDEDQEWLDKWQDAAQKEYDYYNNNMRKLFDSEIGNIQSYCDKITLALTDLGCKEQSLSLTKVRVGDQRETVQQLQTENDDVDLSQIIIDYTAAYTAYQASLTAAGKLGDSTLLNYI
ncbi:flagellar hook-associated protein 3 FlgL [Pseudobutyrivibrio sp. C4]|nr:flagellar hook-associated protein 3 FlgL [Pseudobutyrivibrio sp. C4]